MPDIGVKIILSLLMLTWLAVLSLDYIKLFIN